MPTDLEGVTMDDITATAVRTAPDPVCAADILRWRERRMTRESRAIPEETAIALSYNRQTHAVMMATPCDLVDFAVGFSLAERIVMHPREIEECEVVPAEDGVELRMWIEPSRLDALDARRRTLAGVTGCGMCGLESLAEAMRPAGHVVSNRRVGVLEIEAALAAMLEGQALNRACRAIHAACFVMPGAPAFVREDVGRHNALDKLAGALAQAGLAAADGVVAMTSRISVELVQKLATMGAPVLAAVSAPTALAVRMADAAGITLIGMARDGGFEVYTHPDRIVR